jgi:uncharacterized membrane protein
LSGSGGVNVEEVVIVNASPGQLYLFWRNFEQLPSFMDHLVVVTQIDALRSHWVAKAPMAPHRGMGCGDHQRDRQ